MNKYGGIIMTEDSWVLG